MREKYPHSITTFGKAWMEEGGAEGMQCALARQCDMHFSRDNYCWIDHKVFVAHNPNARHPLSPNIFREYVQFTDVGDGYGWSDGEAL